MDLTLTEEQRMIAESARKVGASFGLDYWRDHDARKDEGGHRAPAGP